MSGRVGLNELERQASGAAVDVSKESPAPGRAQATFAHHCTRALGPLHAGRSGELLAEGDVWSRAGTVDRGAKGLPGGFFGVGTAERIAVVERWTGAMFFSFA